MYFEREALAYPLGRKLYQRFSHDPAVTVTFATSHNRVTGLPGSTPARAFAAAKRTLVVGVRRTLDFATCRPSAHYQLPLATGCPGWCRYCYLHTTLGTRPYMRVYVNVHEILDRAHQYIGERDPDITVFEGAATSDPVALEALTGSLGLAVEFFAGEPLGRFRFATKYDRVENLLALNHGGHTRVRFSVNWSKIIDHYEHGTPGLERRLAAAQEVAGAGYPLGFIIAPVFLSPGWEEGYRGLLEELGRRFGGVDDLTFEVITHRFTRRAKTNIEAIFPDHGLPMDEESRQFKYGQFGYGKFVYPAASLQLARGRFAGMLQEILPGSRLEYLV